MRTPPSARLELLSPGQTDDRMVAILGYPPSGHPGDPLGGRAAWETHRAYLTNLADAAAAGSFPFPGRTPEESAPIARAAQEQLHRHLVAFNAAEAARMRTRWKFTITAVAIVALLVSVPFLVPALADAIAQLLGGH